MRPESAHLIITLTHFGKRSTGVAQLLHSCVFVCAWVLAGYSAKIKQAHCVDLLHVPHYKLTHPDRIMRFNDYTCIYRLNVFIGVLLFAQRADVIYVSW